MEFQTVKRLLFLFNVTNLLIFFFIFFVVAKAKGEEKTPRSNIRGD